MDLVAQSLWFILAFILVGSSLALRRLPKGNLFKLVLTWTLIFAVAWLLVVALGPVFG